MQISSTSIPKDPDWLSYSEDSISSEDEGTRFDTIADQISKLWVGIEKDICVGGVFGWIVNGCKALDNTDHEMQQLFETFQNAYLSDRGAEDEDTTYLPEKILEYYKLEEHPTGDIPLIGKSDQKIAELILNKWEFLNGKRNPVMVILSHTGQTHAYGINKNGSNKYQLFDVRLSSNYETESLEDFTLGIEAHFTGSTTVLQKREGGEPSDKFQEIQFVSFSNSLQYS